VNGAEQHLRLRLICTDGAHPEADTDSDGLDDCSDVCPTQAGSLAQDGCPGPTGAGGEGGAPEPGGGAATGGTAGTRAVSGDSGNGSTPPDSPSAGEGGRAQMDPPEDAGAAPKPSGGSASGGSSGKAAGGKPGVAAGAGGAPSTNDQRQAPPAHHEGCTLAHGSPSGHGVWALLLAGSLVLRRRKREL